MRRTTELVSDELKRFAEATKRLREIAQLDRDKEILNIPSYDIVGYVAEFDFCTLQEKKRLHAVLQQAWHWGAYKERSKSPVERMVDDRKHYFIEEKKPKRDERKIY